MLTVVGLGPGDPDLVTLKALKALRRADAVYVPASGKGGEYAGEILRSLGVRYEALEFPMSPNADVRKSAEVLIEAGERGEAVFALLGDPSLYSTFGKLYPYLRRVKYAVVPGVTAFSACAAQAGVPLAVDDDVLCIAYRHGSLHKCSLADVVVVYNGRGGFSDVDVPARARLYGRRCGMAGGYAALSQGPYPDDYFATLVLWR